MFPYSTVQEADADHAAQCHVEKALQGSCEHGPCGFSSIIVIVLLYYCY